MAFLGETFDANNVAPSVPFEVVPPGKYVVQIVKSAMEPTKSGNGEALNLEMEIMEGPHAGRKVWDGLNLRNTNAQAVEIAQRTLSAICHAVGKLQVSDSSFTAFCRICPDDHDNLHRVCFTHREVHCASDLLELCHEQRLELYSMVACLASDPFS